MNSSYLFRSRQFHTLVLCSSLMILVSSYLTYHFYSLYFPSFGGELSLSVCQVTDQFNCDKATLSPMSHLFYVPISLLGLLMGVIFFWGAWSRDLVYHQTHYFLSFLNAMGCVGLSYYSLGFLGTFCPFCSLYYFLSFVVFGVYLSQFRFSLKPSKELLGTYLVAAIILCLCAFVFSRYLKKTSHTMSKILYESLDETVNYENYRIESPLNLVVSTKEFSDAPLRLSIVSDFRCPLCKSLAEMIPPIEDRYRGKINIRYFLAGPVDGCLTEDELDEGTVTCQGLHLAHCLAPRFEELHSRVFRDQEKVSALYLRELAKEYGVLQCFENREKKEAVEKMTEVSEAYEITAVPTLVINGHKIEGIPPYLPSVFDLLDEVLDGGLPLKKRRFQ